MTDLIRKSALVDRLSDAAVNAKAIEESSCANACTYYAGIKCGFFNAAIIADNFPTVDAVPVVRCRECKNMYEDGGGTTCVYGAFVDCVTPNDFYCAFGERREDER